MFEGLCTMGRTSNFQDFSGQKIGRLQITTYVGGSKWNCICDCGFEFVIHSQSITKQKQSRCRYCFYSDKKIHGCSGTPEYQAWKHIMERCYDPDDMMYPNYGGRGIKVCERWKNPKFFVDDMGKRPTKWHSIDRINVDGSYEPNNCKWATRKEQNNNKTNTIYLEYRGFRKNLYDWSIVTGISAGVLRCRFHSKWSVEKILTQSVRGSKIKSKIA